MLKLFYNSNYIEAGLDEAGRGCLAGPVVAAAVILPKKYKNKLLNDSKKLTAIQRELLEVDIKKHSLSYCIVEVSNDEIDKINILKASIKAMHLAVDGLSIVPEHLLVDGNRFYNYPLIPHTCIIEGDGKFMAIAAASILAKTYRDKLMSKYAEEYPQYHWHTNMGYATVTHRKAIETYGYTNLHRLTFTFKAAETQIDEA